MKKKFLVVVTTVFILEGWVVWNSIRTGIITETFHPEVAVETQVNDPGLNNILGDFTASESATVTIKDFEYIPKRIIVKKGTKVTWINEDEMEHNVMLDHENSDHPHDATSGQDPEKFESPMLVKGERYSFTFHESSDSHYHCSPHPWMKGSVEVVD